MSSESGEYSSSRMNSLDILAATFFVVAGAWLIIALVYSYFVIIFLRLRARGELNSIYEEDFGRVYLCGSTRFYISFGGIFRRYIRHIQPEPSPGEQVIQSVKFMTRAERREAMEILLYNSVDKGSSRVENKLEKALSHEKDPELGQASSASDDYLDANPDTTSSQEPVCSICLGEYEPDDYILRSKTCPHEFHKACVMDWLQRQINTECPCCRSPMVDEEDVWATVKKQRKSKKKKVSRHEVISKVLRKRSDLSDSGRNNTSDGNDSNSSSESTVPESLPRRDLRIESSDTSQNLPEP